MLNNYKLTISYHCLDDDKLYASSENTALRTGHYELVKNVSDNEDRIAFTLNPTVKMNNIKFVLEYNYDFNDNSWFFGNGYQSWTLTKEFSKTDVQVGQTYMMNLFNGTTKAKGVGDYSFARYSKKPGNFHSVSYTYIRHDNTIDLIGSLCERTGYTMIYCDMANNKITVEKDLDGLTLEAGSTYEVMNIFYTQNEYEVAFDKYFEALEINKPRISKKIGYTSWYNYYPHINEAIIKRDLESLSKAKNKMDIFQVDDGYQTAVGDWLTIADKKYKKGDLLPDGTIAEDDVTACKFPNGMKVVADSIHAKDMLAGLWLAPFNAQRGSKLASEHEDWLIRDTEGRLGKANELVWGGMNWGGFYTLDIYNPDAREYIKNVFDVVLNEWKFDMVKLDFLYSVAIVPYGNRTRGQIMCDAMDFLRECCDTKLILGCGVPMFPAFGKVDFCRTGADLGLDWKKNAKFPYSVHNEGVSTPNGVGNTLFRRHLDGRAWCNDPDVFLLRDFNISLTLDQRKMLAKINKIFGNLLFTSDDIDKYDDAQKAIFDDTTSPCTKKVISAEINKLVATIKYIENDVEHDVSFNINTGEILSGSID